MPPLWKFLLDTLNSEQKFSAKKPGRPGRSETGWPAGQPTMIIKFTGRVRVEKILTGSISETTNDKWSIT